MRIGQNLVRVFPDSGIGSGTVRRFRMYTPGRVVRMGLIQTGSGTNVGTPILTLGVSAQPGQAISNKCSFSHTGWTSSALGDVAQRLVRETDTVTAGTARGDVIVKPGGEVTLTLSGGATGGDVDLFFEYQPLPFDVSGQTENDTPIVDYTPA